MLLSGNAQEHPFFSRGSMRSPSGNYLCACGNPIVYSNEERCENCWAGDQQRWSGKDNSVNTTLPDPIKRQGTALFTTTPR